MGKYREPPQSTAVIQWDDLNPGRCSVHFNDGAGGGGCLRAVPFDDAPATAAALADVVFDWTRPSWAEMN